MSRFLIDPVQKEVFILDYDTKQTVVATPLPKSVDIQGVEIVAKYAIVPSALNCDLEQRMDTYHFIEKCLQEPELLGARDFEEGVAKAVKLTRATQSVQWLLKDVHDQTWIAVYGPAEGFQMTCFCIPTLLMNGTAMDRDFLRNWIKQKYEDNCKTLDTVLDGTNTTAGYGLLQSFLSDIRL